MAVVKVSNSDKYTCLAADTKPSSALAGSTCYETDTGRMYIWGGAAWSQMPSVPEEYA